MANGTPGYSLHEICTDLSLLASDATDQSTQRTLALATGVSVPCWRHRTYKM